MFAAIAATMLWSASLPGADAYLAGHEAERAGRYAQAIQAYASCAERPGPLAAYARVKSAFCRAASGDYDGAIAAYRTLLRGSADGPWVRMAHAYLAGTLTTRKAYEEAAKEYAAALDFQPKPWWIQSHDRAAAAAFIECPTMRDKGYDFFRNVVTTTRLRTPRLEAAEQLAKS
ncbi:MAG: tetratricopeptide repeat protein, partial [Candidatus Hydrogenedentes bacterium]|nr:tetratricopeptide repeat protein [Candidatus Hydrogenedentota bacterium]